MDMLSKLWGAENIATIGLGELLSGLSGDGFNDWLQKPYIVIPEAKDPNLTPKQEHGAYESLKSGVDPAPTSHILKTKYGSQGVHTVYSSYIICSNHADTLNIPLNDRRFKFIRCTTVVKSPDDCDILHDWINNAKWETAVWLMLKNRDLGSYNPFAPVNHHIVETTVTEDLIDQRRKATPINRLVIASILFAEEHCDGVFCTKMIRDWLASFPAVCAVPNNTYWDTQFIKALNDVTETFGGKRRIKFKHDGKTIYLRYTIENKGNGQKSALLADDPKSLALIKAKITSCNAEMFRDFIVELNNNTE
jgi:hypothetical protein